MTHSNVSSEIHIKTGAQQGVVNHPTETEAGTGTVQSEAVI